MFKLSRERGCRVIVFGLISILFLCNSLVAQGQNRPRRQSANLELTDDEVNQYWLRAQALGYDIEEIPALALSQGFSEVHATELYNRIVRLQRINRGSRVDGQLLAPFELDEDSVFEVEIRQKIFGMKVFERAFFTTFRPDPSAGTPESYTLGIGDQLSVVVFGTSQQIYPLEINGQGSVIIPVIGPVSIAGLRLSAARELLLQKLSTIYSGMKGPNPTVSIEIALQKISNIRVNIVGEVERPGTYDIPSYSGVFNALYSAGGPTINGTFRNIKVFRGGREVHKVDLYRYLVSGASPSMYDLKDDDMIIVDTYDTRVEIQGEVRRPGLFELKGDEDFEEILRLAGGFTPMANKYNFLIESNFGTEIAAKDFAINMGQTYPIKDGDIMTIRKSNTVSINRVQINGAVVTPGVYEWHDGLTLDSLVKKSGGLMPNAYLSNLTLFRFGKDFTTNSMHFSYDEAKAVKLEKGDVVKIASSQEITETRFVQVSGEVNKNGIFPYYNGMTLGDILILCEGLQNSAINGVIEIARRVYVNGQPSFDVLQFDSPSSMKQANFASLHVELKPLDHIFFRSSSGYQENSLIQILGEVNHPGEYVIKSGENRISDLLERAGGFTKYAFPSGVAILRLVADESAEKETIRDDIARLERLQEKLEDENDVYGGASVQENLDVILQRLENLRAEYEQRYLTTEEGVVDLLTIDARDGVSFSNISARNRRTRRDKIGVDVANILENPNSSYNLSLLPGDILEVPRKEETVRITGRVLYITSTQFEKGRKLKSYISQAGGFDLTAKRNLTYVIYANGDAKKVKNFIFFKRWPEIEPGSRIVVPGGRIRQVFNPERIIALTSSLLTTFLVIDNFLNSN